MIGIFVVPFLMLLPFLLDTETVLLSRSELGTDYIAKQLPNALFLKQVWQSDGRLPMWQPNIMSGIPVSGNPSFLTTYPLYWLVLFFPVPLAINLLFAIHLAIAGIGLYLVARKCMKLKGMAAAASGITFMFSPKILAHVSGGHLDIIIALSWLPLAIFALHTALVDSSFVSSWFTGLVFGFMFVSHAPTSMLSAYVLCAYGIFLLIKVFSGSYPVTKEGRSVLSMAQLLFGAAIGFLLSAGMQLINLIEILPYLQRSNLSLNDAAVFALPPQIFPMLLAIPSVPFPEWVVYGGAGGLVLCMYAGINSKVNDRAFWLIIGILAFLLAFGRSTPLFQFAYQYLPGFRLMRVPSRSWFFVNLVIAIFCGIGFNRLLKAEEKLSVYPGAMVIVVVISTVYLSRVVSTWQGLALAAAILAVGSIVILARKDLTPSGKQVLGTIVLAMLLLELALTGWSFWQTGKEPGRPAWFDDVVEVLEQGEGRLYSEGRVGNYLAVSEHLNIIEGIDAVQLSHYVNFVSVATNCVTDVYSGSVPPFVIQPLVDEACPERQAQSELLGLLNVSHAFTTRQQSDPGWQLEREIEAGYFYRNARMKPLAFLSSQTSPMSGTDESLQALKRYAPGDPLLIIGGRALDDELDEKAKAEIAWLTSDSFEVEVSNEKPAFLALGITYMPGWKAFDESGQAHKIHQTQLAMMGTYIPAGHSKLTFKYVPDSLVLGRFLTLAAAILSGMMLFIKRYRER